MLWIILDRMVNLTFLLLAVVIIGTLLSNSKKDEKDERFALEVTALRQDFRKVMDSNLAYAEGRINKLAETQDEYQVSTSRRIDILYERVETLEKENKSLKLQAKIINTNNNLQIVNGVQKEEE